MRDPMSHPHLAAAHRALAAGDMDALRGALLELDDEERRILEVHLGPAGLDRTRRAVRQRRRARGLGRVVVVHGGLVARRMSQLAPDVWRSMRDGDVARRGGRLIQLGTPNRGSLAIPMALTGEERLVRMLALLDLRHRLAELLDVPCTFIGSYQMLPAPEPKGDDRMHLFERQTWGSAPVSQPLLDRGRALQEAMAEVIDPERIVYVAGYD